jgi:hypothetical protein
MQRILKLAPHIMLNRKSFCICQFFGKSNFLLWAQGQRRHRAGCRDGCREEFQHPDGRIIEANSSFLQPAGLTGIDWTELKTYKVQRFLKKMDLVHARMADEGGHKVVYSEIVDLKGIELVER